MDVEAALIRGLLDQKDELDLNVRALQWPAAYGLQLFDLQVEAQIDGTIHIGRGTAGTEDQALVIATVELAERLSIQRSGLVTSNGVAAHFDRDLAQTNALRELIERDRLLNHIHAEEPFYVCEPEISVEDGRVIDRLRGLGIEMEIFALRALGPYQVRICLATGERAKFPFGMMIGMGTGTQASIAARQAFIECLRHAVVANEYAEESLTEANFRALQRWSPEEHHRLGLNLDYAKEFLDVFTRLRPPRSTEVMDWQLAVTDLDVPGWARGLVHVVHVQAPEAQPLYFGPPSKSDLNLTALQKFAPHSNLANRGWIHPLS